MPLYFFDVHAGSLSEWDDDGQEAGDAEEAISLGKNMLVVANADLDRMHGDRHAVVMIRDKLGKQVATVTASDMGEPRVRRANNTASISHI